jgi:outer membrane protein
MKSTQRNPQAIWSTTVLLLMLTATLPNAHAEEAPWSVRIGPGMATFDESATAAVNGATQAGAEIGVKDSTSLGIDIAYALSDRWTVRTALGGSPAEATVKLNPLLVHMGLSYRF